MVHASETPDPPAESTAVEADERTARLAQTAVVAVEERPPDAATILHRLRTAFPHWAFIHDPHFGRWIACWGREPDGVVIIRSDPLALRLAVADAGRDRSS